MDATKDTLQANWAEIGPMLRKRWGKISEDEVIQINGNTEVLVKVLRKRYGYGKTQAEIEISGWLKELDSRKYKLV